MSYPQEFKEVVIKHILDKRIKISDGTKTYSPEELADHIRNETEVGKRILEAVVRGQVDENGNYMLDIAYASQGTRTDKRFQTL